MNGPPICEQDCSEFVEVDPTGRYWRYNEILGKGASKTVYRAFDEFEGIEVAWNQVKLYDFLQSPEDLERLYCEIHLLKTLKHKNIMKFYTSWVDAANRNINFITEMFTSGTLRQYGQKHKRVNIRAVKHWCRQILRGLLYLHNHDPPVIHRDLKCDNIFINGNQGEVKIGDLGLAAIRRKSHVAHCVGTPEFMAPEVYEEEYNELVDIYSFGMCVLEMVTFEYPYSECTHPAQIYKKVISGKKPDALFKVKDPEVRQFVEKCLVTVSQRLSAKELLKDPFLHIDDREDDLRLIDYSREIDKIGPFLRSPPLFELHHSSNFFCNGHSNYCDFDLDHENSWRYHPVDVETNSLKLLTYNHENEQSPSLDIAIKGKSKEDAIFLSLRIADKEGRIRNIYFSFDILTDTALSVATEMVAELDITDQDVNIIADIIDGEIATLVPGWNIGSGMDEASCFAIANCPNCGSNNISIKDHLLLNESGNDNTQVLQCSQHCCAATHGRFEEITYQIEGSEQFVTERIHMGSNQTDGIRYFDTVSKFKEPELSLGRSGELEEWDSLTSSKHENVVDKNVIHMGKASTDDYEYDEIKQESRWLKAKYQMEIRDLRTQQLQAKSKTPSSCQDSENRENQVISSPVSSTEGEEEESNELLLRSFSSVKHFPLKSETRRERNCEASTGSFSPVDMFTAKSFYSGELLPHTLHRTTSLPIDAVDV